MRLARGARGSASFPRTWGATSGAAWRSGTVGCGDARCRPDTGRRFDAPGLPALRTEAAAGTRAAPRGEGDHAHRTGRLERSSDSSAARGSRTAQRPAEPDHADPACPDAATVE